MTIDNLTALKQFFYQIFGTEPTKIQPIRADGSKRRYYRILNEGQSVVGTINSDYRENVAFIYLSRHFHKLGLSVPEIYGEDLEKGIYLQEDLGCETLFDKIKAIREEPGGYPETLIDIYRNVLDDLPYFQIKATSNLDYSKCYPRSSFDEQSILWDLNYFKYHFLKLVDIDFDEDALEKDFRKFTLFLLKTESQFFLYRDFQSRNIMLVEGKPYYIDYQGGRQGPLQYDIASLLQDGKADIPWDIRDYLLEYYIKAVSRHTHICHESFLYGYYGYALVRLMQSLGAYGYRGLYEGKSHFLTSISHGIQNLEVLYGKASLPINLPELQGVWDRIIATAELRDMGKPSHDKLVVNMWSFSYRKSQPRDLSGNGGGFVFDCRIIPNPGRISEYEHMTGLDTPVIDFLDESDEAQSLLKNIKSIVTQAVEHHQNRGFTDLTIAFGCTGGQHRSVYFASQIAQHLNKQSNIIIQLHHRELEGA